MLVKWPPLWQKRVLSDGPHLSQKKLAMGIHGLVEEELPEISTHRTSSRAKASTFIPHSRAIQASQQQDSASSPFHSKLPSLIGDAEYLRCA